MLGGEWHAEAAAQGPTFPVGSSTSADPGRVFWPGSRKTYGRISLRITSVGPLRASDGLMARPIIVPARSIQLTRLHTRLAHPSGSRGVEGSSRAVGLSSRAGKRVLTFPCKPRRWNWLSGSGHGVSALGPKPLFPVFSLLPVSGSCAPTRSSDRDSSDP